MKNKLIEVLKEALIKVVEKAVKYIFGLAIRLRSEKKDTQEIEIEYKTTIKMRKSTA